MDEDYKNFVERMGVVDVNFLVDDIYLEHHGVKGMRWGIRRYQDDKGNLTPAGKMRYRKDGTKLNLNNMTLEEYNYAMKQLSREKSLKVLKRETPGNDNAIRIGATVAASVGTLALTNVLGDKQAKLTGKDLAKKVLLIGGTTALSAIASSVGGRVNKDYFE